MNRRSFLHSMVMGSTLCAASGEAAAANTAQDGPAPLLGQDYVAVYESPNPDSVYAYSPGITRLPNGRLIVTMDQGGPGLDQLPGVRKEGKNKRSWRGKIFTSDDHGRTWTWRQDMPLIHARPFTAGNAVYVLGHRGDLGVMRSTDNGDSWDGPHWLTDGQSWHQAPCNVLHTRGKVYLVMERKTDPDFKLWAVSILAPVVMAANEDADLTQRVSWTFSNELSFKAAFEQAGPARLIGVPFFPTGILNLPDIRHPRSMAPIGWLETNIVQFNDPNHVWHDPNGRTFHLWMRAHTGGTNLAALARAHEAEDGAITVSLEKAPSGDPMLYVPCPGGHLKFHILHDDPTGLFWLVSNQSTDSMTSPGRLPEDRYSLPNNERHRLVLHFSKNCVDWCFACRVADSGACNQGRNYPSMVIDGDDLHVLSRSGDSRAVNAHDGNLITFHTIKRFRGLAY